MNICSFLGDDDTPKRVSLAPLVFTTHGGMWFAQTEDHLGLVSSGACSTQMEARNAWREEYEAVKKRRGE